MRISDCEMRIEGNQSVLFFNPQSEIRIPQSSDAELTEEETEFIGQVLYLFADGQPAGVSGLRVVVQEQLIEMMRGKSANTT